MVGGTGQGLDTTNRQSIAGDPQISAFHAISAEYINLSNMLDSNNSGLSTSDVNAVPLPDCASLSCPKPAQRTFASEALHANPPRQPSKLALPKQLIPPKLREPNTRRHRTISRGRDVFRRRTSRTNSQTY